MLDAGVQRAFTVARRADVAVAERVGSFALAMLGGISYSPELVAVAGQRHAERDRTGAWKERE